MNKELLFFCKLFANEVTQLQYSGEISKARFYHGLTSRFQNLKISIYDNLKSLVMLYF